jgi:hypothetical protein
MATLTPSGAIPSDPSTIRAELITTATALSPGLTADLPASLIEDMASTATGALVYQDQAYVDLVNSISPITANTYITTQLGNVYGVQRGVGDNTSVFVQFTGTPGFVINVGFLVSDGTYTYSVQDGTIVPTGGITGLVYCLATVSGSWAVPANTVTAVSTSVPSPIILTVTNPNSGIPGQAQQDPNSFRAQVIQAGNAVATGTPAFVKTTIQNVPNVVSRLVSLRQAGGGYEIVVGGGDPFEVSNAIYQSLFNFNNLVGAQSGGTTINTTIYDYPDLYNIVYVQPFLQTTTMTVHWTVSAESPFVSNTVVASAIQTPIQNYINSIVVGQPISNLELQEIFVAATAGIIVPTFLSTLRFTVNIASTPFTGALVPDPILFLPNNIEGYYFIESPASIVVYNYA